MRTYIFYFFFLLSGVALIAQPENQSVIKRARLDVNSLCAAPMAGRGYIESGHLRAASFIARRFSALGVEPLPGQQDYFQRFTFPLNLVRSATLSLDGDSLLPGKDFIVFRASGSGQGKRVKIYDAGYALEIEKPRKVTGRVVVLRDGLPPYLDTETQKELAERGKLPGKLLRIANHDPAAVVILREKLTAAYDREALPFPVFELREDAWPGRVRRASFDLRADVGPVQSQNVLGYIPGTLQPDSFLFVSAHYDHLGKLGEAVFAGANDNASGTAMLLELARRIAQTPLPYSVAFVGFGAEECGLVGSRYYVDNERIIPLSRIRFLLNIDLMGNGDEGIVAVAGREFPALLDALKMLNDSLEAVPLVRARGNTPNSDHYFFVEAGVPAFFIYTLGGPPHYHDIYDTPENLRLSRYGEVTELLLQFLRNIAQ